MSDFHHASLFNSFIMLFETRLGGEMYRPIGKEWFEQGYWKVYDHPETVEQFLGIGGATPDGTPELNSVLDKKEGVYFCHDIDSDFYNMAITLDKFFEMPFDLVIASLPQHIEPFKRLCERHPNKPKLIYQIGNAWNVPDGLEVKNVMASAVVNNVPSNINFVQYHQEFDLTIFKPQFPVEINHINSFVNCFSSQDTFTQDWQFFLEMEKQMEKWRFFSYGGQCRDGAKHGARELAKEMRYSRFIWHVKKGGDGYGHVLFNSAAVGRPIIYKKSYYEGKLGAELMIDDKTGINIDGLTPSEVAQKIEHFNKGMNYWNMCWEVRENFKKVVNFDAEFEKIKGFLNDLQ